MTSSSAYLDFFMIFSYFHSNSLIYPFFGVCTNREEMFLNNVFPWSKEVLRSPQLVQNIHLKGCIKYSPIFLELSSFKVHFLFLFHTFRTIDSNHKLSHKSKHPSYFRAYNLGHIQKENLFLWALPSRYGRINCIKHPYK